MNQHLKSINSNLSKLAQSRGIRDVFTDLIDLGLYKLIVNDAGKFARNPFANGSYKPDEQELLKDILLDLGEAMEGYQEPLGDIFMEHLSFGKNGQFFTPMPVASMMAMMTIPTDVADGSSVCDPACGSGRTLLAAAKINRNQLFYGNDVDLTCVKMTVFNMAMNSLRAEIHWMNTISLDHYGSFAVHRCVLTKLPYITTHPADETLSARSYKKSIAEMPVTARQQYVQATLF